VDYQAKLINEIFSAKSSQHPIAGVKVYHNNFVENGIRALSITFPTITSLMGESDFRGLARSFLLSNIKTQFDWADYGAQLADYIMSHPNFAELPYLSEVAEFDWLIHQVQRSNDKSFDGESFEKLNTDEPQSLVFELAPGFTLAKFFFPVELLYRLAHEPELQNAGPEREEFMLTLNKSMNDAINAEQARSIVLWRPDYKAEMLSVSDHEITIFQQLQKNESIENVFASFDNAPEQLSAWLSEQIMQKRIYGVRSTQ
jgi:hypothetical protein